MGARLPSLDTSGLDTAAAGYRTSAAAATAKAERQMAALNRIGSTVGNAITRKQDIKRSDAIRADENARSDRRWEESKALDAHKEDLHRAEFGIQYKQGELSRLKDDLQNAMSMPQDDPVYAQTIAEKQAAYSAAQQDLGTLVDQYAKNPARPATATSAPMSDAAVAATVPPSEWNDGKSYCPT